METIIIGDTSNIRYDPLIRVNHITDVLLPRIKNNLCQVTVWYIMKLEAKTWSLAAKVPNITEQKLLQINESFRALNIDHLRLAVIEELHRRKIVQTKLDDWLVIYV